MAEFIELLSDQAIKEIKTLVDAIAKGANNVEELSKKFKQIQLPSETLKELQTLSSETAKLNAVSKESERINKALVSQQAKYAAATSDTNRDLQKLRAETNKLNREHRVAEGLYARVSAAVNKVSQRYNDLALRKELNGKLTNKEATELDRLQQKLSKYQTALKKVDANIGRYSRNVGNYASGWNGLSNSINQLTREAPAFANSMQTGFMALSNNIPILIDEIDVLRRKNMLLAKEGKATKSVFGTVASAFFSWQTALSVGVTLLTLYGAQLVDLIQNFFDLQSVSSKMKDNLKEINEAMAETAASSIAEFKGLIGIAQDYNKTEAERLEAVEKLKEAYPGFNAQLLNNKTLTAQANIEIERYIVNLENQARATAALSVAGERFKDAILIKEEIKELEAEILKNAKAMDENVESVEEAIEVYEKLSLGWSANEVGADDFGAVLEELNNTRDDLNKKEEEANAILDIYIDNLDLATEATKDFNRESNKAVEAVQGSIPYWEDVLKTLKQQALAISLNKDQWQLYLPAIQAVEKKIYDLKKAFGLLKGEGDDETRSPLDFLDVESQNMNLENTIAYFEEQIKLLKQTQKETSRGSNEYQAFAKQIEFAEERLQALKDVFDGLGLHAEFTIPTLATEFNKLADAMKKAFENNLLIEQLGRLTKQLNMDINVLVKSFETLSSPDAENWEKKAALAQGSYQVINGIAQTVAQNEQTRIQNQIVLNREYYQEQIRLAEGNQAQQDFLREERDAKERKLRIKQAKAEREAVLFEIAINTASAIVQALPNIGLSIAVGAIGALQAALVRSAPLPQFKHGRKGGKETWAILGDGYKNEPIVDKQGNLKAISPNRPTMMHLDKGDSVLPDMNRLNDEILNKTMLMNVQASANRMTENNQNKGLERLLSMQNNNLERSIIKSLRKAKFVNVNNTKVDLGFHAKLNKYKGN